MQKIEKLLKDILRLLENPDNASTRPVLAKTLNTALQDGLDRIREEKEFHQRLNQDMIQGMHKIYREIAKVTTSGKNEGEQPKSGEEAAALFHEASRQLDEIMTTTLKAADDIMSWAENIQERQQSISQYLDYLASGGQCEHDTVSDLKNKLAKNGEDITSIVVALSFQDLTGQRIKKVVQGLGLIHQIVVETYVTAGLMIKKSQEEPGKDLTIIAEESKKQAAATAAVKGSKLKGPTLDSSQKDVDDLLAQLGL
jgi:chemotaxis protein CheZ